MTLSLFGAVLIAYAIFLLGYVFGWYHRSRVAAYFREWMAEDADDAGTMDRAIEEAERDGWHSWEDVKEEARK